ncbi:MAG: hypothetical protein K1X65_06055 [Caldilineales bacterium]|nr:hypothetical protein [Caldilineales bacterium]
MKAYHGSRSVLFAGRWRYSLAAALALVTVATLTAIAALAYVAGAPATVVPPGRLGGASGNSDQRDADVYPAIAYDATGSRFLVVWLSPRNAGSQSDGFDVYGRFLNPAGQPAGSEFRISDTNSVARSSLPSVAAANGTFAVVWTVRGGSCQVRMQRVVDASARSDQILVSGAGHRHSPSIVYNATRQRFVVAYVEGDDYLPPTIGGAQTADCGNNASSASRIKALEFALNGDSPTVTATRDVSDAAAGGFRPRLAFSSNLAQYLVAWEDRRNAGGQAGGFAVYAQRLAADTSPIGSDLALANNGDYSNYDASATWTPRPAVAAAEDRFLVVWFAQARENDARIWSVLARPVSANDPAGAVFPVVRMTYAESHNGEAPSGFLATDYLASPQEFMVTLSSHLESIWGYLSLVRVQRITKDGQLLKLDGAVRSEPGVGNSVDSDNDDQIGVAMATNPSGNTGTADYLVAYSKHAPSQTGQDFDIWGGRIALGQSPSTCLSAQFTTQYFNNQALSGSPTVQRCETAPFGYDWGYNGPVNGVNADHFSVRWAGRFVFESGNYTFISYTDDGVRVWIDNNLVIDRWIDQGATEYRATRSLSSGEHDVKVEYYENVGAAVAAFRWQRDAPADTTPPTGDFTEPVPNAQVNAPVWLRVQAQDNAGGSGMARVKFTTNGTGQWRVIAEDNQAPYELYWDMSGIPTGQAFMIGAELYDNAGNRADRARWITRQTATDTTPPTGDFTEPAANAQVNPPVWLRVQAQDTAGGSGIAKIRFTSNGTGQWRLIGEDSSPPYEVQWDMAGVPVNQPFMIGAEIHDRAGNRTDRIRWITKQGAVDTTPPSGDFTEPAANSQVAAPVWLRVQAQDNAGGSGVARVVFTTNGTGQWRVIASDVTAPYEMFWDMAGVPSGQSFMIGAEIYDTAGNRADRARWITRIATANSLRNGDFEQGRYAGWDEYSTHGWQIVVSADQLPPTRQPHGGSWAAWLGGEHSEVSAFWQRGVSIQPSSAYLQFWYMIGSEDYCGYDFAGVVINGSTVARAFDLCAETNTGGWVRTTVNLSAYSGQNVTIAFRSETDSSLYSSFWVDDLTFATADGSAEEQPVGEDANAVVPSEPGANLVKQDRLPVQPQAESEPWPRLWEGLPTK